MVKVIQSEAGTLYQCEECSLKYKEEENAQACKAWCREHHSCNLDIIKDAIQE